MKNISRLKRFTKYNKQVNYIGTGNIFYENTGFMES